MIKFYCGYFINEADEIILLIYFVFCFSIC